MSPEIPIPKLEKERLQALLEYEILDSNNEDDFDRLTQLASIICGVPIALVSLIDKDRQWFKSKVGLNVSETPREISFCQFAIMGDSIFQVEDATKDERFQNNPLVKDDPNIRFYAGFPLIDPKGFALGTLCVIDKKTKSLSPEQIKALNLLSEEVVSQIVSRKKKIEKTKLKKLFNLSLDLICIAGVDGYFKEINPAFQNILGWSIDELKEKPFIDFFHEEDKEITLAEIQKLSSGKKTLNFENRIKNKNGNFIPISWVANPDLETGELFAIGRDITQNKNDQLELNNLLEFQKAILNGTDYSVIATNTDGMIVLFNSGAEKMLGYKSSEVVNKFSPSIIHVDEEIVSKSIELSNELGIKINPGVDVFHIKSRLGYTVDKNNWTYVRKDGTKLIVNLSITTLRNERGEITGYLGVAQDITENKKNEQKIKESEEKFLKLFENNPVAIALTSLVDNKYKQVNSSFCHLTGYSREEIINNTSIELNLTSSEERERILNIFNKDSKVKSEEGLITNKSGKKIWVLISLERVVINSENYILTALYDITMLKDAQNELIKARMIAEESLKAKDVFLANMSHEIRTPMNAILGFSKILRDSNLTPDQRDCVSTINIASENLLGIINDILDFSKIESGKILIENVPFNIHELLKNIYNLLNPRAIEKGIRLNLNFDEKLPTFLSGDPTRLNQILLNIINNGIKFTPTGEVNISINLLEESLDNVEVEFKISDSGIGIPKEKLETIFDRFTQADANTTRKYGGTGLGLSISKALVNLLNGNIKVLSEINSGSQFIIQIAFKKISPDEINKTISTHFEKNISFTPSILLVEDNILNQKLALRVIKGFGFEIDLAENGKFAIEKLLLKSYDLILMDLQMPEMDGYDTTMHIRNVLKLNTPIIAMTAHSLVGEKDKCIEMGMNDYISKPFFPDELYNKILFYSKNLDNKNSINNFASTNDEIVNLNYLKELSGGSIEFEHEMILLFIEQVPQELSKLKKSISEKNFQTVKSISHKLKSTFSLLGVGGVEHLSKLEKIASEENIENIITLFNLVDDISNSAIEKLKIIIKK